MDSEEGLDRVGLAEFGDHRDRIVGRGGGDAVGDATHVQHQ
jgi:hypothetical protein